MGVRRWSSIVCVGLLVVVLDGCSDGADGGARDAGDDLASGGSGGMDAASLGRPDAAVDPVSSIGEGGGGGACPVAGTGGGRDEVPRWGVGAAVLDGDEPEVREVAALGLRHVRALAAYDDGVVVGDDDGFWVVPATGAPRFVEVGSSGEVRGFLVADVDADGAVDLVSIQAALEALPVPPPLPLPVAEVVVARVQVWRRRGDDLELASSFDLVGSDAANAVAVGDVTGDGQPDLVAAEGLELGVYVGDGAFGFTRRPTPRPVGFASTAARALSAIDHDGDGDVDVVVVVALDGRSRIETYGSDGHGALGAPVVTELAVDGPLGVQVADLTGDGFGDLAFVAEDRVVIATGDRQGGYALAASTADDTHYAGWPIVVPHEGALPELLVSRQGGVTALRALRAADGSLSLEAVGHDVDVASYVWGIAPQPAGTAGAATVYLGLALGCQPPCGGSCAGTCFFEGCLECVNDAECASERCEAARCVPTCERVEPRGACNDADAG